MILCMSDAPATNTTERSILIADIVKSTELYERLGNVEAQRLVSECLHVVGKTVEAFHGQVIKSLGDGILASFRAQQDSVWAAVGMCEKVEPLKTNIRVGVHWGEVLEEQGDVFGDTVNTAARIVGRAKPSEILISRELSETLPQFLQDLTRPVPPIAVKGKREPIEVFTLLKDSGNAGLTSTIEVERTVMFSPKRARNAELELSYRSQKFTLSEGQELTVGRDPGCGLQVDNKHVSRLHARIFCRQGKFILEDQSANGTFLLPQYSKLHILREETFLHGSGLIYLGADPDVTRSEPILFAIP